MKKSLIFLFTIPMLVGCARETKYTGPKIKVERNESGALVECDPEAMYNKTKTDKIDGVFYIGDESCVACTKLKPQLESWCEVNKGTIYYIDFTKVTETTLNYLINATEGYYVWTENATVPKVYFYMEGEVTFAGDQSNSMKYLMNYVEVKAEN